MIEAGRDEDVRIDLEDLQVRWLNTGLVKSNSLYLNKLNPDKLRRLTVVASF